MATTFFGSGLVWIPKRGRCIRFVDGKYSTDDEAEAAVLELKYKKEEVNLPEPEPEPKPEAPKRGRPRREDA